MVAEKAFGQPIAFANYESALTLEEAKEHLHATEGLELSAKAEGIHISKVDGTSYGFATTNGIGIINMFGPIFPRSNMMTQYSGALNLSTLLADFIKMYNDPNIKGIVFNIDTPGGDVRGISDASTAMWEIARYGTKPVKSFVSGFMASAGYYLGSIAQEIVSSRGGFSGSIGVVMTAQRLPNGTYEITSSQSPYKRTDPSTEEGRKVSQELVDDIASIMIEDIAKFRGVTPDAVIENYGQGKVFTGPTALKLGLVDRVGTLASVVDAVAKEANSPSFRPNRKVSAEVDALLSFSSEEFETMGLFDYVRKFKADTASLVLDEETIDGQAQEQPAAEGSNPEDTVAAEGQSDETTPQLSAEELAAFRAETVERCMPAATLFAEKQTLAGKVFPAEEPFAASDYLIASVDDALFGGTVEFLDASMSVVEGTRVEALTARYGAKLPHSMTQKAVASVKSGDTEAIVLAEEPKEKMDAENDDAPLSEDRRRELLAKTQQGQRVLSQQGQ